MKWRAAFVYEKEIKKKSREALKGSPGVLLLLSEAMG
jgi:hypothetical protein